MAGMAGNMILTTDLLLGGQSLDFKSKLGLIVVILQPNCKLSRGKLSSELSWNFTYIVIVGPALFQKLIPLPMYMEKLFQTNYNFVFNSLNI